MDCEQGYCSFLLVNKMSKTIMLNSRFWEDNYISELDPSEKLLFLYCLTNLRLGLSGIYEVPLNHIAVDTGLDQTTLSKLFKRFENDRKILFLDGWICIINYPKYQNYESDQKQTIHRGTGRYMVEGTARGSTESAKETRIQKVS